MADNDERDDRFTSPMKLTIGGEVAYDPYAEDEAPRREKTRDGDTPARRLAARLERLRRRG